MSFWQKLKNKCLWHDWNYFMFAPWEEYRICRKCSKAQEVQYPFGYFEPSFGHWYTIPWSDAMCKIYKHMKPEDQVKFTSDLENILKNLK